jgi:hypothetical protein
LALILAGVLLFLARAPLSKIAYRKSNPVGYRRKVDPVPGTRDIPGWVTGLDIVAAGLVAFGLVRSLLD